MSRKRVLIVLSLLLFHVHAEAQSLGADSDDAVTNFQPSLAVVIGILSIMFSLTFLLLLYAKFCHRRGSVLRSNHQNLDVITRSASGLSGIDKSVIKSLPFFRFSALRGSRGGLECAVCLSRFEDVEVLRLLPKCKHAFHIDCVDRWLEKHSSCPLCRHKVSADDVAVFASSDSLRFLSELREDSNIELFVQREEDRYGSSRFSVGSSFRRIDKGLEDRDREEEDDRKVLLGKFEHEIVLSGVVFRNRWSNVSSSDLMLLNSEMINDMSSNRFTQLGSSSDDHKPNSRLAGPSDKRSMSDITAISRFGDHRNMIGEASSASSDNVMRKQWLPIAKRTVEWFADREKKSTQTQETNTLHV